MRRVGTLAAVATLSVTALVGCTKNNETYTRADLIASLTGSIGVTDAQAECIADGVEEQGLSIEQFGKKVAAVQNLADAFSKEDQQKLATILSSCLEPGTSPPSSSPGTSDSPETSGG